MLITLPIGGDKGAGARTSARELEELEVAMAVLADADKRRCSCGAGNRELPPGPLEGGQA